MSKGLTGALALLITLLVGTGAAHAAPPSNDDFATAAPLAVGAETSSANVEATAEPGEPDVDGVSLSSGCITAADGPDCSSSVWYSFEPAASGEYTIETCDLGTELDTTLGVYTGELAALTLIAENNNAPPGTCPGGIFDGGEGSQLSFAAVGGTLYRVYLGGRDAEEGSFWIRAYAGAPKPLPTPDTGVIAEASAARNLHAFRVGPGIRSGPRHTSSLALRTKPQEAQLECSLDGAAYSPCSSAVSYDGLAPGSSHVLRARAKVGGVVDPTPLTHRLTIDTSPPQTTLTPTIAGEEALLGIGNSERSNAPIAAVCGLDSMSVRGCLEAKTKYVGLCQGMHSVTATAIDLAANPDPTPASAQFPILMGTPCAAPALGPPGAPSTLPTQLVFPVTVDVKGAGAELTVEYGKTASYGESFGSGVEPSAPFPAKITIPTLTPSTTYHYRVVLTTPFGSAATPDQIATTDPAGGPLPGVVNGTPAVAGRHAAGLPVTIDTHGEPTEYRLLLEQGGPVDAETVRFDSEDSIAEGQGVVKRVFPVADLEPSTAYRYRFFVRNINSMEEVLGPEGTFTTPPAVVKPPVVIRTRFRLRKGQVTVKPLSRKSKKLVVIVRRLPTGSKAKLRIKVGKKKQTARKKAKRSGVARFRFSLSKRIRKELLDDRVKRFSVRVTAIPPEDPPSSVTIKKRIRKG